MRKLPSTENQVGQFSRHALELFFDSEQKNSADMLGPASRHLDSMMIRSKLLSLSERSYRASVLAINGILDLAAKAGSDKTEEHSDEGLARREKAVKALYKLSETEVSAKTGGPSLEISKI